MLATNIFFAAHRRTALVLRHSRVGRSHVRFQVAPVSIINGHKPRYAVLVDADNVHYSSLAPIMEVIATLGADASVRRMYGNFKKPNLAPMMQVSQKLSFKPVNAISYVSGKGSSTTDAVMIIEAMDLLHDDCVDGFALVTSDSDFTPLAQRLCRAGKYVVGFGEQKTPAPLVTACDQFFYTENSAITLQSSAPTKLLASSEAMSKKKRKIDAQLPALRLRHMRKYPKDLETANHNSKQLPKKTLGLLNGVIKDAGGDGGWLELGCVGRLILSLKSNFDVRSLGYRKLIELFQDQSKHFELRRNGKTGKTYSVRSIQMQK